MSNQGKTDLTILNPGHNITNVSEIFSDSSCDNVDEVCKRSPDVSKDDLEAKTLAEHDSCD